MRVREKTMSGRIGLLVGILGLVLVTDGRVLA